MIASLHAVASGDAQAEERMAKGQGSIHRMGRGVARTATAPFRNYVNRQFIRIEESWQGRMQLIQHRLLGDIEAAAELTSTHARSLTLLNERLDQLNQRLDRLDGRLAGLSAAIAALPPAASGSEPEPVSVRAPR